nr:Transposon Ty3-I Gag-Pol polyprotein [Ipomoea batatas]
MIEGCVNEARMAQWEEMGELCIEEEDIEEPCTEEDVVEELYATNDPIGEEPPPKVELKPLPPNLRYEFLDSNFSFPVIVNASLENDEIKRLLDRSDELPIDDTFRGETLFILTKLGKDYVPWFADIVNYLVSGYIPKDFSYNKRKRFLHDVRDYFWDEPLLFKRCVDGIVRRCVPEEEFMPRNKSIAKKPAPKVPQVRGSGTLRFNSAEQRERYQAYMQKPVVPPYVIKLDTLEEFGIREEVEALLGEKEWKYILVDFEDAIYPDLVLEAMTTLQVPKTIDLMSTKCISFTVGSIVFQFSPDDLSRYLEIDAMQGLSEEELEQRETDVPNMLQFWTELSGSNTRYDASSSKSSLFSKPLKLIQHTLSRSICGRQYSTGVAQTLDMLCLYGMVKKVNVHLGWVFAFLFQKQSYLKVKTLFVGPYLTRILRNAHNSIIPEIPYKQLPENKTEINRDILLSLFKDMRAILGPVGNTKKRARRGAAAQAHDRAEEEEENEEGHEEETQAMPEEDLELIQLT